MTTAALMPVHRRRWPPAALGTAGLAALLASTVAIALGASAGPSMLVRVPAGEFVPWVAGPLRGLGDGTLSGGALVALLVLMTAGYTAVLATSRALPARTLLAVIVALHVAMLLAPPLLTTDIFSYIDYGRLGALHGIDPYAGAPLLAPHDAVYPWVGWRHARSAYGPLFTLLTYPLAALRPGAALWMLKSAATAACLGCVALVWRAAPARGVDPVRAAALVGLNPLVLTYAVGGGHNDLLMMLGMTAAVTLVLSGREGPGAASLVAAVAMKAAAVVVLPFLVLGSRRRWRVIAAAALAGGAFAALALAAFGGHAAGFLTVLELQQRAVSAHSLPALAARLLGHGSAVASFITIARVAGALALAALLLAAWRGADWVACSALALVVVAASTGWLMPWYAVWALPLAALCSRRRVAAAVLVLQALVLVQVLAVFAQLR